MSKRHQLDRIIVGNQITIMRALADLHPANSRARRDLVLHVADLKDWWRREHGEEVGFSTAWGDQAPR